VSRRSLRVNPIACEAHGLCAELLPEHVTLDEWGYPIIDPMPLAPGLEKNAKRAVAACPRAALLLAQANGPASGLRNARSVGT
jgi:ferredoxin